MLVLPRYNLPAAVPLWPCIPKESSPQTLQMQSQTVLDCGSSAPSQDKVLVGVMITCHGWKDLSSSGRDVAPAGGHWGLGHAIQPHPYAQRLLG